MSNFLQISARALEAYLPQLTPDDRDAAHRFIQSVTACENTNLGEFSLPQALALAPQAARRIEEIVSSAQRRATLNLRELLRQCMDLLDQNAPLGASVFHPPKSAKVDNK